MTSKLYHLVPTASWQEVVTQKVDYFPPTYDQDGFIHLTKDPALLLSVANHFYKDVPGEYLVLEIDESKLKAEVKYEAAAPVGDKETTKFGDTSEDVEVFPHLYGTIDYDAVIGELKVERSPAGEFLAIEGH